MATEVKIKALADYSQAQSQFEKFTSSTEKEFQEIIKTSEKLSTNFTKDFQQIIKTSEKFNETIFQEQTIKRLENLDDSINDLKSNINNISLNQLTSEITNVNQVIQNTQNVVPKSTSKIYQYAESYNSLSVAVRNVVNDITSGIKFASSILLTSLTAQILRSTELAASLGILSGSFTFLGLQLIDAESNFAKLFGVISLGISAAINPFVTILKTSFTLIGTQLIKLSESFGKFIDSLVEKTTQSDFSLIRFTNNVQSLSKTFPDLDINARSFLNTIEKLSNTTSFSKNELLGVSGSLIELSKRLGLTTPMINKLIEVSADLASSIGVDIDTASQDLIKSLEGNEESLNKYGISLNDNALNQINFSKGSKLLIEEMDDLSKTQLRYNFILSQYEPIAGNAEKVASNYTNSNQRLENTIKNINNEIGKGILVVKDFALSQNILISILNTVPNIFLNISGSILETIRIALSFTGQLLIITTSLISFLAAAKSVRVFFSSGLFNFFINTDIPLLKTSLNTAVKSFASVSLSSKSFTEFLQKLILIIKIATKDIILFSTGINISSFSISKAINTVTTSFLRLNAAILANPIVLISAAIAGLFFIISKAIKTVESLTGVFSDFSNTVASVIKEFFAFSIFDGILETLSKGFDAFFGIAIFGFNKILLLLLKITDLIPSFLLPDKIAKQIDSTREKLNKLNDSLVRNSFSLKDVTKEFANLGKQDRFIASIDIDDLTKKIDQLKASLKDVGKSEIQILEENFNESRKLIRDSIKNNVLSRKEGNELLKKLEIKFSKEILAIEEEAAKKERQIQQQRIRDFKSLLDARKNIVNQISDSPLEIFSRVKINEELEKLQPEIKTKVELELKKVEGISALTGAFNTALKGASGALAILKTSVSTLVETLLPGLGKVVGEIFEGLSKTPEEVKKLIGEFFTAIPTIIQSVLVNVGTLLRAIFQNIGPLLDGLLTAIIEGFFSLTDLIVDIPEIILNALLQIDEFIFKLVDSAPLFIDRLINELPRIIEALVEAAPALIIKLNSLMPLVAVKFATSLITQLPTIVFEFAKSFITEGIPAIVKGFIDSFKDAFNGLFDALKQAVPEPIRKVFGFQEGGLVKGFGSKDSIPAMLAPNELVVDRSLTDKLESFLNESSVNQRLASSGQPQNLTINLTVGEEQLASVMVALTQKGFRIA